VFKTVANNTKRVTFGPTLNTIAGLFSNFESKINKDEIKIPKIHTAGHAKRKINKCHFFIK
jgi:hypothetical protein